MIDKIIQSVQSWFSTNAVSIVINILSSILYVILAALVLYGIREFRRRTNRLARFLRIPMDSSTINICYGLIEPPQRTSRKYFLLEQGDVTALYTLIDILSSLYGRQRVVILNHRDIWHSLPSIANIVSISGPLWNKVAEYYIGAAGSPVLFYRSKEALSFLEKDGASVDFLSEYSASGRPRRCYAMIIGGPHVTNIGTKQRFLICAGSSNLSTYAAILFLRRLATDQSLGKMLSNSGLSTKNKWGLILRVENWSEVDVWSSTNPIKASGIEIAVEKIIHHADFSPSYEYHY